MRFEAKRVETAKCKIWQASCSVFEHIWWPNCTMRSLTEQPKRQQQNNAPVRFQGQSSSEPERCMLKQKGAKLPNTKIGERPVLFLSTFGGLIVQCGRSRKHRNAKHKIIHLSDSKVNQVWHPKGAFWNEKATKSTPEQIGERPVLFL